MEWNSLLAMGWDSLREEVKVEMGFAGGCGEQEIISSGDSRIGIFLPGGCSG